MPTLSVKPTGFWPSNQNTCYWVGTPAATFSRAPSRWLPHRFSKTVCPQATPSFYREAQGKRFQSNILFFARQPKEARCTEKEKRWESGWPISKETCPAIQPWKSQSSPPPLSSPAEGVNPEQEHFGHCHFSLANFLEKVLAWVLAVGGGKNLWGGHSSMPPQGDK